MGEALYRKYRSRNLGEIVGQGHITRTLDNAVKSGKISHAYLLTGPKGVGKTSIARILAADINGLAYDDIGKHLDIIEIDAASNRRIDEIRDLRDKVNIAPTSAKYKVYIIDEVHMLTREAFNALLKTLEEPPEHAIFILATTESHKVPETIKSRTQVFTFKPISRDEVSAHLQEIAKKEGLKIDDEALGLIADFGEGSFRDSIGLLDQISAHTDEISSDNVRDIVGIPSDETINAIFDALDSSDSAQIVKVLRDAYVQGIEPVSISKQLITRLRNEPGKISHEDLKLIRKLFDVQSSADPRLMLEIILLEQTVTDVLPAAQTVTKPTKPAPQKQSITEQKKPEEEKPEISSSTKAQQEEEQPQQLPSDLKTAGAKDVQDFLDSGGWNKVLTKLKGQHNTLYGIVRMAKPTKTDGGLNLEFGFPFHQRRCSESRNMQIISQTLAAVSEINIKITTTSKKAEPKTEESKPIAQQTKPADDTLETVSNIFGGGEVME